MPSSKYIPTSSRGRIIGLSSTGKSSDIVGGAVPLLLKNSILKTTIKGGAINEPSRSNIMVGTVTSSVPTRVLEKTVSGGELLSNMQKLKFGKGVKSRKSEENIRFLF